MPTSPIAPPAPESYAPYFRQYVDQVPEGDVLELLAAQPAERRHLHTLEESQAEFRYAPDKWSLKQVLGHVTDTEIVFLYRALRFARDDATPLPGFDQDLFAAVARSEHRSLADMLAEFEALRRTSVCFAQGLDDAALDRGGKADGKPQTVRSLLFLMAGHEAHHQKVIRERYLAAL